MDYNLKSKFDEVANIKNDKDLISNIIETANDNKVLFIRLQFVDILGVPKNIVIPVSRLDEAFEEGIPFDASSIAGYATIEESDKIALPDPNSFIILPETIEKRKTAKINCDIFESNGERFVGDTKYILERVVDKAKKMGYIYNTGPECEFFLFKKEGDSSTIIPNDSAGYFDLSHRDLAEGIRADICVALESLGINTYTSHHEVSDGQHEINFRYADALTTADRIITLKYVAKVIARIHNLHASFMPKPLFGLNGSGMHTHLSLFSLDGNNIFYDPDDKNQLSETSKLFIAGLLKYVKEITCFLNPTVNSYKRLVPGFEAPTYISWAFRNRSALIRIPTGRNSSTRCELRSPDLSGNPYLQFALILAAGLRGIEESELPPDPVEKNIYSLSEKELEKYNISQLPDSLGHALALGRDSLLLKDILGEHVLDNFLHVKYNEWDKYRTQITKWETEHYLPII